MINRARLHALAIPWQLSASAAGAALLLLASFGSSDPGVMEWRLRLAGVAFAATAAFVFDDAAAATVAPSPTRLPVRQWHRCLACAGITAALWITTSTLLHLRFGVAIPRTVSLELLATTVVTIAAALALARWAGHDSPGAIGAVIAPSWFALGHVPRPRWIVVPPQPGSEMSVLLGVTLVAAVVAIVASRDPLAICGRRSGATGCRGRSGARGSKRAASAGSIASSSSFTSDWERVTGRLLQLSLVGKPKISRWPYLSGGCSRLLHHSQGREPPASGGHPTMLHGGCDSERRNSVLLTTQPGFPRVGPHRNGVPSACLIVIHRTADERR